MITEAEVAHARAVMKAAAWLREYAHGVPLRLDPIHEIDNTEWAVVKLYGLSCARGWLYAIVTWQHLRPSVGDVFYEGTVLELDTGDIGISLVLTDWADGRHTPIVL